MGNLVFRGRFMIVLSHLLQKTDLKHVMVYATGPISGGGEWQQGVVIYLFY